MSNLERRVQRLEDIEAIKQLKARYFSSCDLKQVDEVRNCFAEGPVNIDYGKLGNFEHRDGMVELFEKLACHDHIVEMHHGQNPQIEIIGPDKAKARWGLFYHLINKQENSMTQLGGYYSDVYVRSVAGWKILSTVFRPCSSMVIDLDSENLLFAGNPSVEGQ